MFPNSLTLETGLQQALDLRPPRSVSKAEFDPAGQQLRGLLCSTPALCRSDLRRGGGALRRGAAPPLVPSCSTAAAWTSARNPPFHTNPVDP